VYFSSSFFRQLLDGERGYAPVEERDLARVKEISGLEVPEEFGTQCVLHVHVGPLLSGQEGI